jgi:site-specific DNA-methyltransferase (adenine-specific)
MLQTKNQPDILEVIADLSSDLIFTPPKVANAVLDLLPPAVWNDPGLRWLDPGSKTGVFPREITRRLMIGLEHEFVNEDDRLEHILHKMVFGVATTELTSLLARRSLYCSKDAAGEHSIVKMHSSSGNIWFERTEHTYVHGRCTECAASEAQMESSVRDNHAYAFIHSAGREAVGKDMSMKFDVIVGNPPYQMDSDGNRRTMPIYDKFVAQAKALNPRYIAMIIPARWMAGGLGLDAFRAEMLADKSVRKMVDYPNANDLFPGVDIKGGICYFLWDRDQRGPCEVTTNRGGVVEGPLVRDLDEYDVFVRDAQGIEILKRVSAKGESSMYDLVRGKCPFGLRTNYSGLKQPPSEDAVKLYRSGGPEWTTRDEVLMNDQWIDSWKVLIPQAGPGNSGGHVLPDMVLGQPLVAAPGSCCTETYMVVGPLKSEDAALSLASYMRTRFFRYLVSLRKVSQHAPRGTYSFVPQQSWDRKWTDEELFNKYELTEKERTYIADVVREMPG